MDKQKQTVLDTIKAAMISAAKPKDKEVKPKKKKKKGSLAQQINWGGQYED